MVTDNAAAERVEEIRDLRSKIEGLNAADQQEIIFRDTSPRVPMATVWRLKDGYQVRIPAHLLEHTLKKRDRDGSYLFTAYKEKAPTYKPGEIKCFLHPEADERELLDEIGLAGVTCPAGNLRSMYSKRMHAQNRHGGQWALYREAVDAQATAEIREEQRQTTAAMIELARSRSGGEEPAARGRKAKPNDDTDRDSERT